MSVDAKKNKLVIVVLLIVIELICVFFMFASLNNKVVLDSVKLNNKDLSNGLAIMLEIKNEDGTTSYVDSGSSLLPDSGYKFNRQKSGCLDANGNIIADFLSYDSTTKTAIVETDATSYCYLFFDILVMEEPAVFDYTGDVQTFNAPATGTYQLEVWGASGGTSVDGYANHGGFGGYATGVVELTEDQEIYIYVGEKGQYSGYANLGNYTYESTQYNGGGSPGPYGGGGGGATHIATTNRGELTEYEEYQSEVLIVAGGGGGASYQKGLGGSGGGLEGGNPLNSNGVEQTGFNGTQTGIGSSTYWNNAGGFGYGGSQPGDYGYAGGGGAGWYGGNAANGHVAGGGGSGYIANINKGYMINGVQAEHGYAKITYLSDSNNFGESLDIFKDGTLNSNATLDNLTLSNSKLYANVDSPSANTAGEKYASVKNIDLTNYNRCHITVEYLPYVNNNGNGEAYISYGVDLQDKANYTLLDDTVTGDIWQTKTVVIDVSSYTGTHDLYFYLYALEYSGSNAYDMMYVTEIKLYK